jgi:hypothetical protein
MPIHDWTRVAAGIFHDFHHAWIEEIKRSLNNGILPDDYYAMAEQHTAAFGPDVLTLQGSRNGDADDELPGTPSGSSNGSLLLADPRVQVTAETDMEFYRRKQNMVTVRHVSGDKIVAMVEIVSPGNKSSRKAMRDFVAKATELLDQSVNLLILDLFPPSRRDPRGIHGAIWEDITAGKYAAPPGQPRTLAAYASDLAVRAFIQHLNVGEELIDMPLFLERHGHVLVPLERTYEAAFQAVPRRWRRVLAPKS